MSPLTPREIRDALTILAEHRTDDVPHMVLVHGWDHPRTIRAIALADMAVNARTLLEEYVQLANTPAAQEAGA